MHKHYFCLTGLLVLALSGLIAQAPQGINYQCVVRNADGTPLKNETRNFLFAIRTGPNGTVLYAETQLSTTNEFGLINLVIGSGTPLQSFPLDSVHWSEGNKFLTVSVETSPNVYEQIGNSPFQSVPYALYALTPAGPKGEKGDPGDTGPKGDPGAAGPKGDKGDTGLTGPKGDPGSTGTTGAKGEKGDPGNTGLTGPKGDPGSTGATGPKGEKGDPGDTGATGPKGDPGERGEPGIPGPKGEKGEKGEKGDPGDAAPSGIFTLSGDVSGGLNATVVTGLQGYPVSMEPTPDSAQVLCWNGNAWAPATLPDYWEISCSSSEILVLKNRSLALGLCPDTPALFSIRNNGENALSVRIEANNALYNSGLQILAGNDTLRTGQNSGLTVEVKDRKNNNQGPVLQRDLGIYVKTQNPSDYAAYFDGNIAISEKLELVYPPDGRRWSIHSPASTPDVLLGCTPKTADLIFEFDGKTKGAIASTGGFCPISDRRLKDDILPLSPLLSAIQRLHPVSYHLTDDASRSRSIGFIAQEVEAVFPELIHRIPDQRFGELLTLNYDGFTAIAIRAIQEQQTIIEQQQNLIESQAKKLQEQEARQDALEQRLRAVEEMLTQKEKGDGK